MSYKIHENKDYDGKVIDTLIINKETGAYIPVDPSNVEYAKYLVWVAEGNTPEEAG